MTFELPYAITDHGSDVFSVYDRRETYGYVRVNLSLAGARQVCKRLNYIWFHEKLDAMEPRE